MERMDRDLIQCPICGNKNLEFLGVFTDGNGWQDVPAFGCPDCYIKERDK